MESNQTYVERLQLAVAHLHKCDCAHVCTTSVTETFRGQLVWEGEVETFDLIGHPQAKRCYAWSHASGKHDTDERFVAVLAVAPIDSPKAAVQAAIVSDFKRKQSA